MLPGLQILNEYPSRLVCARFDGWAGADYDVGAGRYRLCLGMTNKALQPIALWRCASSSILITVSSTAAQPRFQSGG